MKTKNLTILAVCFVMILTAAGLQAAGVPQQFYADVWADIQWDSLKITLADGMSITQTPSDSYSRAMANDSDEDDEVTDELPGWVNTSANMPISDAHSTASTSDSLLTTTAYTGQPDVMAPGESAYAESESWRDGTFLITGSGTVTFEIDYRLETDLAANIAGLEATGYAEVWLILKNTTDDTTDSVNEFSENTIYGPDTSLENLGGTFVVSLHFDDGDSGYFDTGTLTYGETVAPEPTTIFALTFGATTLLRKRRHAA